MLGIVDISIFQQESSSKLLMTCFHFWATLAKAPGYYVWAFLPS